MRFCGFRPALEHVYIALFCHRCCSVLTYSSQQCPQVQEPIQARKSRIMLCLRRQVFTWGASRTINISVWVGSGQRGGGGGGTCGDVHDSVTGESAPNLLRLELGVPGPPRQKHPVLMAPPRSQRINQVDERESESSAEAALYDHMSCTSNLTRFVCKPDASGRNVQSE